MTTKINGQEPKGIPEATFRLLRPRRTWTALHLGAVSGVSRQINIAIKCYFHLTRAATKPD
jgi:hypothetical protein